jgi:hypothetical protein
LLGCAWDSCEDPNQGLLRTGGSDALPCCRSPCPRPQS